MKDFYERLSKENNYMDVASLTRVYYSILRVIIDGMTSKGTVRLPDWGEFRVHTQKRKNIRNVNTGVLHTVPETKIIKFVPCTKLKERIKNS